MKVAWTGWLCVDCAMVVANGDTSGIGDVGREAEVLAGVERLGPHACIGDDSQSFSWIRCDCCLTRLAGERLELVVLEESTPLVTTEPAWADRARATGRVVWTPEDGWID